MTTPTRFDKKKIKIEKKKNGITSCMFQCPSIVFGSGSGFRRRLVAPPIVECCAHTTTLWIFNTKSPRNANGRYITFFRARKAFEIPTREKFALQIGYEFEICQVIRILISPTHSNGLQTNGMQSSTANYLRIIFFVLWDNQLYRGRWFIHTIYFSLEFGKKYFSRIALNWRI